ncbi:GPI-anchored cell wall beta-1,3-endoglucanase EglC [Moelleriella libera RCEF 2490]|uniref:Probable glucan endo-1,3-beta-glucosidase eglC n=1 Tax=Moelleriella libera RCEF 2490 TaxID=1081109 RepID=A0A168ANX6_9HYPO|nr:GPI-anchored cell wall beta-1,3-endoglucanase EglC [Moelleriella libera RCEF 2490]
MAAAISGASAAFQGFNYGSTFTNGVAKTQSDFEAEFKTAAGLDGTKGAFKSARLYTTVQHGTPNTPISAIPAAISTKTTLLLGLWASAGQDAFNNELAALRGTISQYCGQLDGLVAGISVGSEDLYRISPIGMAASPDPGASPNTLVSYIKQVRDTVKGSCLEKAPIGHVDTWTAYDNATNKAVIDAVDFIGMDAYPYYENTKSNGIDNALSLFQAAVQKTKNAAAGKPIWITETGWPVSGPKENFAVAGTSEAQTFWQQVGCPMFGNTNVWWFTLQDGAPQIPSPAFGVIGSTLTTKPVYDLSCDGKTGGASSSAASQAASQTSSAAAAASSSSAAQQQSSAPAQQSSGGAAPATTTAAASQGGGAVVPPPAATTLSTAAPGGSGSGSGGSAVAPPVSGGTVTVKPPVVSGSSSGSAPVTVPTNAASRLGAFAGVAAAGVAIAAAAL